MISAARKDFLREVKNSRTRFLSIMILVALAVAFLSGLRATAPDMKRTGDGYLDRQHLMDIQVLSNLGLTDEDVAVLGQQTGIASAVGVYAIDAWAGDTVAKVWSIADGVNELTVEEGRMPEAADECVVDKKLLSLLTLQVGDTLKLTGGGDFEDALRTDTYTIVGSVVSPYYISMERGSASIGSGQVRCYVYLPAEAFDLDYYTAALLTVDGAAELTAFYDEYDDRIDEVIDSLDGLADTRAQLRHDDLIDEATEKIDDAQAKLDQAKTDAEKELSDARTELDKAAKKLRDGWADYRSGRKKLEDAYAELTANEKKLADAYAELTDGEDQYAQGQKDYADGLAQYNDGLAQYNDGLAEYNDGIAQYRDGTAEAAAGKKKLDDGKAELVSRLTALGLAYDSLSESGADAALAGARAQLTGGIAQIDQAAAGLDAQIAGLQTQLAQMEAAGLTGTAEYQAAAAGLAQAEAGRTEAAARKAGLQAQLSALDGVTGATLVYAKMQLESGYADYAAGQAKLSAARAKLDAAAEELAASRQKLADAKTSLTDAEAKLAESRQKLQDSWAEYDDGKQKLSDGWKEYDSGRAELDDAYAELLRGGRKYRDALQEYQDGKAEAEQKIADAEDKLADARRKVADIDAGEWYVLSRSYDPGYTGFGQDADRMANLASVFPVIFFLVAALVCLTTMTRMVEEERTQIGLMKALGYGPWAISRKYMSYGLLPSLAGSALGLAVGHSLFPTMIYTAYQIMYEMPNIRLFFYPSMSGWASAAAVACTTLATLWACLATLGSTAAGLMRPRAPKPGKRVLLERIPFLWRRLSFNWKITVRNLLRYQKRFWMTVVGIGGCTALIIAGFGLRYSLLMTMDTQYGKLFHYDAQVTLADNLLETERQTLEEQLAADGNLEEYTYLYATSVTAESAAYSLNSYLEVMEPDVVPDFVDLHDAHTGEPLTLPEDGVLIDQKLSELLGLSVGDTITISDSGRYTATVAGIYEHYVAHFIYLSPTAYEKIFGETAKDNSLLLRLADNGEDACEKTLSALLALPGVSAASRMADIRTTYLHSMERVDFVVVVVILCAAALAVVVLYNLSNINITERKRELATIKVLGFYDREVSAYVYRENIILTAIGIGFGALFGHYLHAWLIRSVEIDLMMFGRSTDSRSYLYAAGLTVLFSAAVNFIAHLRMKQIDMVESLKSAE